MNEPTDRWQASLAHQVESRRARLSPFTLATTCLMFEMNAKRTLMAIRWMVLLACLCSEWAVAQQVVHLTTHELPPYSFTRADGSHDGIAVKRVRCAFDRLRIPLRVEFLPWARAQLHARQGLADGFFAASQSAERDSWAVRSVTIAPQQWRWYLRQDSPLDPGSATFKQQATVASFVGANMLDWLRENGYRIEATPFSNAQLLDLLIARRVDAILANHLVMEDLRSKSRVSAPIRSTLEQDKPLSIYLRKSFLAEAAPDFLPRLNQAILACAGDGGAAPSRR